MASMTSQLLLFIAGVVLAFCTTGVSAGDSCPIYDHVWGNVYSYSHTEICSNGCCGRFPEYYCCVLSTAAIAGIILGALVVICLCVFVCVQCLKKKSQKGRVIRPVPATNTVIFTGTSGSYPLAQPHVPPHHQVPQPPPYKRVGSPPPGYSNAHGGAPPPYGDPRYAGQGGYGQPAPPPPNYAYGQGHAWSNAAPAAPTQPDEARTSAASVPPPAYASAAPANTSAAAAASSSRQFSYGQGQGWSTAASTSADTETSSSAVPPTPSVHNGSRRSRLDAGRGHDWAPPTAASGAARPASVSVTSTSASAIPATPGPARQGWSDDPLPNRNTQTTNNFPARLPPLPND